MKNFALCCNYGNPLKKLLNTTGGPSSKLHFLAPLSWRCEELLETLNKTSAVFSRPWRSGIVFSRSLRQRSFRLIGSVNRADILKTEFEVKLLLTTLETSVQERKCLSRDSQSNREGQKVLILTGIHNVPDWGLGLNTDFPDAWIVSLNTLIWILGQ